MRAVVACICVLAVTTASCTEAREPRGNRSPAPTSATTTRAAPTASPGATTTAPDTDVAAAFDVDGAVETVRRLARLGPREATSTAYARAGELVQARFRELGYTVHRQRFSVPRGVSWGVPVSAGTTYNVVAHPVTLDPGARHLVVGAHLDTVPQSPGAVDNASGVAVVLELARLAARSPARVPVVFVAFGAEEPRGPGDDAHHYGAQEYVRRLPDHAAVVGMVSLDRVGTGRAVPVCTGGLSSLRIRRELLSTAARIGVRARPCENRTSDHWPFEKAGFTVARLGGNDYPAYHSANDRPRVLDRRSLERVGRLAWEWLRD